MNIGVKNCTLWFKTRSSIVSGICAVLQLREYIVDYIIN